MTPDTEHIEAGSKRMKANPTTIPLLRLGRLLGPPTRTAGGKIGSCFLLLILLIAVLGPFIAPFGITDIVDLPYAGPSAAHPLGTDFLGRDILTRFLHGGQLLIAEALAATCAAIVLGGLLGIVAGSKGGRFDTVVIWIVDVLLSVPALILGLLVLAALGSGPWTTLLALSVVLLPGSVRITRAATLDAASTEYVEAAVVRGEGTVAIALREILPNIRSVVAADFGMRLAYAAMLYAGLSFLGLGQMPPTADWALMVGENRPGLETQPLGVIAPAAAIAIFTVAITLVADSIARSLGRTEQ